MITMYVQIVLGILCLLVVSAGANTNGSRSVEDCILWLTDDTYSDCYLCLPCSDGSGIQGHICRLSLCDGKNDCDNGEDEEEPICRTEPCSKDQWRCTDDKQCICNDGQCDGNVDCLDGSDEDPDTCIGKPCSKEEIKCDDKMQCFHEMNRCDGHPTCSDKSDEANCTEFQCSAYMCTGVIR
ncbi:low-density lipoprotein receptor-like [Mytilus trossulus]|uniref:low-density lipoprotein receptor-like n=1 Tax=Mytilus trossulus TaxID=6551 RepID=UPI00300527C6